jgi:hypothetical protein
MGQIATRVFHHLDQVDVIIFDHCPIYLNHLRGGEGGNRVC